MNNVSIIGRLVRHPELRFTTSGTPFAEFSVAVDNLYSKGETPAWVNIQVWGQTAESLPEHTVKGDQVAISGRLDSESWTDKDDNKHFKLYVTAHKIDYLHRVDTDR